MNEQDCCLPQADTCARMRAMEQPEQAKKPGAVEQHVGRGARWEVNGHAHAYVRAFPEATAHPADEAWPRARFARLQRRLLTVPTAVGPSAIRRSIVVLPSRSVERWHEPPAETRSYEERLLSFLFELHNPGLEITYVTSVPIAPRTVDYYFSLLPARLRLSARKRLRLVSLGDDSQRPLSEKLLDHPHVLEQIRRTLADPKAAYLLPYNVTASEQNIALALDIPVFGPDPDHAWLGTKSGSRALFAGAGVPHPLGAEQIRTISDTINAIRALRAQNPVLAAVVIKLDHAVSGEGNALLELAGLPAPGTAREAEMIRHRLEHLIPEAQGVTPAAFLRKLAEKGGVVEERIAGCELRSPSVQLEIAPRGAVTVLSTHDQILHGRSRQQFAGCRFPADRGYAPLISTLAQRVGQHLADSGVIGRLGIDFVVTRKADAGWRPFALEVNLRMGGTTHPYQTLAGLSGGSYDQQTASFTTPDGRPRHYVAVDHLELRELSTLGQAGLLARAAHGHFGFDHHRGRGVVFHMLSSVERLSTVGMTVIAEAPHVADDLYGHVHAILAATGSERTSRNVRTASALGTNA